MRVSGPKYLFAIVSFLEIPRNFASKISLKNPSLRKHDISMIKFGDHLANFLLFPLERNHSEGLPDFSTLNKPLYSPPILFTVPLDISFIVANPSIACPMPGKGNIESNIACVDANNAFLLRSDISGLIAAFI
jgi:hypothetical protein